MELVRNHEQVSTEPATEVKEVSLIDRAADVLAFLEKKTGKRWRARHPNGKATANAEYVIKRLQQGYDTATLKTIISAKQKEWGHNADMAKFVRPQTLFEWNKNFEKYLAELGL